MTASPTVSFALDERLAGTSLEICDLELCHVRLQDDARWPWLVLIPRAPGLVELEDLAAPDRTRLMEEVVRAGEAVRAVGAAVGLEVDKLNVGALGNVVPQLHVHVVGRRQEGDPAGAGPVWGVGAAVAYGEHERRVAFDAARESLARELGGRTAD